MERFLTSSKDSENDWINNIFKDLHICNKPFALMFEDIPEYYYKLFLSGSKGNILKAFKFIDASMRNVRQHIKIRGSRKTFQHLRRKIFSNW